MGVGAIFISTLALHYLPPPLNPPQTQQDILTLSIYPIVSFVVLSSIIVRTSAVTTSSFHSTHILLDGLSIPFFNLGQNVSRTVSLTATLTSHRSRFQPDWVLNINHIVNTLQESSTSEVPNEPVHGPAASANTPTSHSKLRQEPLDISTPSQMPDIESGPVVNEGIDGMESLKRSISLD